MPGRSFAVLASIAIVAAGCVAQPVPELDASAHPGQSSAMTKAVETPRPIAPVQAAPTPTEVIADPVLAKLDRQSRFVVAVIEPGEDVDSILEATHLADLVADGRARGLAVTPIGTSAAEIHGRRDDILSVVARPEVTSANLTESLDAGRWISPDRPAVSVPTPGSPYLGKAETVPSATAVSPERLLPLLAALGDAVTTIDGRPYEEFLVDAACQPDLCTVDASGHVAGSADVYDLWGYASYEARGWRVEPIGNAEVLGGVPRGLARAAEWIARHDPPTARQIAQYASIGSIRWLADRRGVIEIDYVITCTASGPVAPAGTRLASDMVCINTLRVLVDVGTGQVVDVVAVPDTPS